MCQEDTSFVHMGYGLLKEMLQTLFYFLNIYVSSFLLNHNWTNLMFQ